MTQKKRSGTGQKTSEAPSLLFQKKFWLILCPALAFLLYANTLTHGFVLDDVAVITENKFVQKGLSGYPDILKNYYWAGYWENYSGLYRPMSLLLFATIQQITSDPMAFHFIHVLLNALLAFLLLRFLFRLLKEDQWMLAVLASLLYIFHPMHTEVVANIKSADELLSMIFFLLSGTFLLKAIETEQLKHKIISAVFIFLALLSKEGAVLFIPVLFLLLLLLKNVPLKKIPSYLLPHLVLVIAWWGIHYAVIAAGPPFKEYDHRDNALMAASGNFIVQKATAIGYLGRYLVKSIIPYQMSYDYSFPGIPNTGFGSLWPALGLLLSIALLFLAIKTYKKNPILSFSILFFFITISLTSNIFRIIGATMADRFLFVPGLGIALLIAWLILRISTRKKNSVQPFLFLLPLLLYYSFKTVKRNGDWESSETLYEADVKAVPNSARIRSNFGSILLNRAVNAGNDTTLKRQLNEQSAAEYAISVELDPNDPIQRNLYGVALYRLKNYSLAKDQFLTALKKNPGDNSLYLNLGNSYYWQKQYDSSIYFHELAIEKKVANKETWNFLGSAWFAKQQYDKALQAFNAGIKADATFDELWQNCGSTLAMKQRYAEAIPCFKKAYELNNKNLGALQFLAQTYQFAGDSANMRKTLELLNSIKSGR